MSDGVFLVNGGGLTEMEVGDYVNEDDLQSVLERYPAVLAGAQVNAQAPRRWLLIRREAGLGTREGGSDHFSVDHLFVDQDGIPTIVEVKRSTDTRIRREVVGQMLDYAANGVKYWPIDRLRDFLITTEGTVEDANAAVTALVEADEGDEPETVADAFWAQVEDNLTRGRLRLLFVADRIPDELQRIIEFLNEQMTKTEVLGIALTRHRAGDVEVLSSKVIGRTQRAAQTKGPTQSASLEELIAEADPDAIAVGEKLRVLAQQRGWHSKHNKKSISYMMANDDHRIVSWYPSWNSVDFSLRPLADSGATDAASQLQASLGEITSHAVSAKYPSVPSANLLNTWERFVSEWIPACERAYISTWGGRS